MTFQKVLFYRKCDSPSRRYIWKNTNRINECGIKEDFCLVRRIIYFSFVIYLLHLSNRSTMVDDQLVTFDLFEKKWKLIPYDKPSRLKKHATKERATYTVRSRSPPYTHQPWPFLHWIGTSLDHPSTQHHHHDSRDPRDLVPANKMKGVEDSIWSQI